MLPCRGFQFLILLLAETATGEKKTRLQSGTPEGCWHTCRMEARVLEGHLWVYWSSRLNLLPAFFQGPGGLGRFGSPWSSPARYQCCVRAGKDEPKPASLPREGEASCREWLQTNCPSCFHLLPMPLAQLFCSTAEYRPTSTLS